MDTAQPCPVIESALADQHPVFDRVAGSRYAARKVGVNKDRLQVNAAFCLLGPRYTPQNERAKKIESPWEEKCRRADLRGGRRADVAGICHSNLGAGWVPDMHLSRS